MKAVSHTNHAALPMSRRAPRARLGAACALALLVVPAAAQAPADTAADLAAKREELVRTRENEARIRAEIAALASERAKLSAELVKTADGVRNAESRIAAAEDRLAGLAVSEGEVRRALDGRRAVISELLAALQRLGRQPPPALLVRPEDALSSVRSAMLLGSVLPEIRGEAEALATDLAELERVRKDIAAQREALARDHAELEAAQARISLLIEARRARAGARERELDEEQRRAGTLARDVASLEELIGRAEREIEASRKAAEAAAASRPGPQTALADPGRMAPAIAFAAARGRLPLPVNGVKIRRFGEADGYGVAQRGLSISTRPGAQVTAPADGWVVYAGPFRSYGQLLILNTGGGYHVLLAGMGRITVANGQFVLLGEPVAEMGAGAARASTGAAPGNSQPVLYVEFRKDGASIDPGPWWAVTSAEKVRG